MAASIVKDGSIEVYAWANAIEDQNHSGSAMAIIACWAQEQVWVRSASNGHLEGGYGSHFAGILLYPGF